jgi:DNA-binding MarR family transcriptional regulator
MSREYEKMIEEQLREKGVLCMGFGTIPKIILRDSRLTVIAKLIYAYFCSYAGNKDHAYPRVEKIAFELGIDKSTFPKHLKILKKYGYLRVEQSRKDNHYSNNVYYLVEKPITQRE